MTTKQAVTFPNRIDARSELELFRRGLKEKKSPLADQVKIKSLRDYLFQRQVEPACLVFDRSFVSWMGELLSLKNEENAVLAKERSKFIRVLAQLIVLRSDFKILLDNDRGEKHLMNYFLHFSKLSEEEQKAVSLFLCHVSSIQCGKHWLLYTSKWSENKLEDLEKVNEENNWSNAHVTMSVCKLCLEHAHSPLIRECGLAAIFNLSLKSEKAREKGATEEQQKMATMLVQDLEKFAERSVGVSTEQKKMIDIAKDNYSQVISEISILKLMSEENESLP